MGYRNVPSPQLIIMLIVIITANIQCLLSVRHLILVIMILILQMEEQPWSTASDGVGECFPSERNG